LRRSSRPFYVDVNWQTIFSCTANLGREFNPDWSRPDVHDVQFHRFHGFFPFLLLYISFHADASALVNIHFLQSNEGPRKELFCDSSFGYNLDGLRWVVNQFFLLGTAKKDEIVGPCCEILWLMAPLFSLILGFFQFYPPQTPPQAKSLEK